MLLNIAMNIKTLAEQDYPAVAAIYQEGIATGNATFATAAPSWSDWDRAHTKSCRLAAEADGKVLGWAALTPVSDRCVYAGVAEVSVYIAEAARGRGIGRQLLEAVIAESEQNNIWTLEARIFPENTASLKLHENCGFKPVGRREKLGKMNELWRDVLLLERRSDKF